MTTDDTSLLDEHRLRNGYVLILPGIEGRSPFNRSVLRGLRDAGIEAALEIHDWTWRLPFFLYNLRSSRLHREQTDEIVRKIIDYRERYPGRPVWLIGHSGGGAMALYVLQSLPEECRVTGVVLLGAAMSRTFDLAPALARVERAIWNVRSWGDCFFLGLFTLVLGTVDGRHRPAIGMIGCSVRHLSDDQQCRLVEMPWRWKYLLSGNPGEHFGYTSRPFVRKWIAPLLRES